MIFNYLKFFLLTTYQFFFLHVIEVMDDPRFNVIFYEDFDDNYDNVMNRIVDRINHPSCEGSGASVVGAVNDGDGNNANDDSNDDDDDGDDDDNSDDDNEFILRKQFDMKKLIICTTGAINMYYINYMHKEPCMISYNIGMRWLNEVLRSHWKRCINMFRMDSTILLSLCNDLETHHGLQTSRRMNVIEKVAMFLFTIAVGALNRQVQERFQHSSETVNRCLKEVLKLLCLFVVEVMKPIDS
jgi:hypothetical protein